MCCKTELDSSGRWLSGSPIMRICLTLRVNLSSMLCNQTCLEITGCRIKYRTVLCLLELHIRRGQKVQTQVYTVNSNSRTSNCQCSLISKRNPIIRISGVLLYQSLLLMYNEILVTNSQACNATMILFYQPRARGRLLNAHKYKLLNTILRQKLNPCCVSKAIKHEGMTHYKYNQDIFREIQITYEIISK